MRRTWTSGQRGADDGAAAVEFALLFPVFMALVLGMITAGISFERWIGITQGVREGGRLGATLSVKSTAPGGTGTVATWLTQVYDSTKRATGLSGSEPGFDMCVALTTDGTTWTKQTPAGQSSGQCPYYAASGDGQSGPRVQVTAKRDTTWNWFWMGKVVTVKNQSVTRWEPTQ